MSSQTDKQYLEIQREQIRIDSVLNLLRTIYRNCKNDYGKVLTTDYLKEKSLPHQVTQVIVDKGLVRVKGIGAGKTFLWLAGYPDEQMADMIWTESIRVRNEYEQAKLRERRGESPTRVQIGNKNFVKLLNATPTTKESVLKKQPTSVTEVKVIRMLKAIQVLLTTGQHVMDFASLCEHKGISTKWEKTFLKTVVGRTQRGFEWIGPEEVEYDTVRKVIDTSKEITETEIDIPTLPIKISQEVKSEFEKVIEKTETSKALKIETLVSDSDNKRMINIFEMLHSMYNDIKTQKIVPYKYCTQFKLTNNMGNVLITENIIKKIDGIYKWIAGPPTKQMIEQINTAYIKKYREYYENKKLKQQPFDKKTVQLMSGAIETPKTIVSEIANEVIEEKKQEKEKLKILAEKFAKAGNYTMAEQLLDQVLKLK